jgi:hypothetical protein
VYKHPDIGCIKYCHESTSSIWSLEIQRPKLCVICPLLRILKQSFRHLRHRLNPRLPGSPCAGQIMLDGLALSTVFPRGCDSNNTVEWRNRREYISQRALTLEKYPPIIDEF